MADLPPLETIPEAVSDAEFKVAGDRANWARTFGGNDRSLAQRARRNADIREYGDMLVQRRQQEFQGQVMADKGARDFWYKTKQLELQQNKFQAQEAAREQSMRYASQLQPSKLALQQSQLELDAVREKATTDAEARRVAAEARATLQANQLSAEIFALGLPPGSPEYRDKAAPIIARYPFAPKEMLTTLRGTLTLDPEYARAPKEEKPVREEFFPSLEDAKKRYPGARITGSPGTDDAGNSGYVVTSVGFTPTKEGALAELERGASPAAPTLAAKPSAAAKPSEPVEPEFKPAEGKLYGREGRQITFAPDKNFAASVQQAFEDDLIDEASARKLLESRLRKKK